MATAPEILAGLRRQLAARFPTAPRVAARALRTGLAAIDDAAGGLPLGAVTEIVGAAPSCGSHLLLEQLLAATRALDLCSPLDPSPAAAALVAVLAREGLGPGPDRFLAPDLAFVDQFVASGDLLTLVEEHVGSLD